MNPKTYYSFVAKSQHLLFFGCTLQKEFVLNYVAALVEIYHLEEGVNSDNFYLACEGSAKEIRELFLKGIAIKVDKLARESLVLHELDKIFNGQTNVPFIYVDGKDEYVTDHTELMSKLFPEHNNQITQV